MHEPTVVSLCTGAGGLDLGLEQVGYRVVAVAEVDRDASRILSERFPGTPNLGDLRGIRWEDVERPDVVAAGFPCQPLSLAGKGLVEADPRWLWPEVARCLRVLRPRFVLLENVPGIFRRPPSGGPRPIGVVLADLAALGYDAVWTGLRAADIGAPHGRDRWFCVAVRAAPDAVGAGVDADGGLRRGGPRELERPAQAALPAGAEVALAEDALADRAGAAPDAGRERLDGGGERDARRATRRGEDGRSESAGLAAAPADAGHGREHLGPRPAGREGGERSPERTGLRADGRGASADADGQGREGAEPERAGGRRRPADGGQAAPDAGRDGLVRVEAVDGADGGVDVESGDDADRRDLGGAGAGDGHAGEAPADADGDVSGRDRGGLPGAEGTRGGRRDASESRGREAASDADGAGVESGCGRRATSGGRSRRDEALDVGDRYVRPADSEGARAGAPDAEGGNGPQLAEGDGREPAVVGAVAGAGGRDSGGETPEGVRELGRGSGVEWGPYESAIRRWEYALGRAAPRPTDDIGRLDPRFPEWMLGFPEGWVDVEGVSRTAQLRLIGNAVQVQCGMVVGAWLAQIGGFA